MFINPGLTLFPKKIFQHFEIRGETIIRFSIEIYDDIYDDLEISLGSHSWDSIPVKSRVCLLLPCSAGLKFGLNHLDMGGLLCANPCAHTSGLAAYIGNACYTVIMVGFMFNPYGVSGRGT